MPTYDDLPGLWQDVADAISGRISELQDPAVKTNGWGPSPTAEVVDGVLTVTLENEVSGTVTADCPSPAATWDAFLAAQEDARWHRALVLTVDPLYTLPSGVPEAAAILPALRLAVLQAVWPSLVISDPFGANFNPGTSLPGYCLVTWYGILIGSIDFGVTVPLGASWATYTGAPLVAVDRVACISFEGYTPGYHLVPLTPGDQDALAEVDQWSGGGTGLAGLPEDVDAINHLAEVLDEQIGIDPGAVARAPRRDGLSGQALTVARISGAVDELPPFGKTMDAALRRLARAVLNRWGGDTQVYDTRGSGVAVSRRLAVLRGSRQ